MRLNLSDYPHPSRGGGDVICVPSASLDLLWTCPRGAEKSGIADLFGAPEEIRTPDPQIRSLVLYPAELRARLAQSRRKMVPPHRGRAATD